MSRINAYLNRAAFLTLIVLTLCAGSALAQDGGGTVADSPSAPQDELGPGFTYQGELRSGGSPITGYCDIQFKLFDAPSGPAQLGGTLTHFSLGLVEGRFTTQLNLGDDLFDGSARWLEIAVRCPAGSGDFTTLIPRQPITAAPYAHSLRPGAEVVGAPSSGPVLFVHNNIDANFATAIQGYSDKGYGVRGSSDTWTGVLAQSNTGWAIVSDGPAQQVSTDGGWVKANLLVVGSTGAITRCFNSQSTPAVSQTNPCGFAVTRNSAGSYTIDFNFTTNDRFFSITPYYAANTAIVPIVFSFPELDKVTIKTLNSANTPVDSDFFITVY
jgi:hypothetical protein